jgi:hypothetical protein
MTIRDLRRWLAELPPDAEAPDDAVDAVCEMLLAERGGWDNGPLVSQTAPTVQGAALTPRDVKGGPDGGRSATGRRRVVPA